jgi:D-glycero-alpha-D-manno-heptose 1-phosphate guanylyltransferase
MVKEAVVLAGGLGTRLRSVVTDLPKPMADVNGRPFLEYVLNSLLTQGVSHAILSVGHLHEKISGHFRNAYGTMKISYSVEHTPLGTGGGIRAALNYASGNDVLVCNGDSLFRIDIKKLYDFHVSHSADATLALRHELNASRYGIVETAEDGTINRFSARQAEVREGWINGGIYILNKHTYLRNTDAIETFSIEKDFFERCCGTLSMYGLAFNGYFIDIGVPEDYIRANNELKG